MVRPAVAPRGPEAPTVEVVPMHPTSPTPKHAVLVAVVLLAIVFAGCTGEPRRDLREEASDRLEYAKDNNAYDPIARIAGPQTIAPGAVVWYSAVGSVDPDFIGAKKERDEAISEGGLHYQDDTTDVHFTWWVPYEDTDDGLGTGIRKYLWQVDDGPVLESSELTERYGTEDGPVRFPVGFAEPGKHVIKLTVIDWSGDRDSVQLVFDVAEGGVGSAADLADWSATPEGYTYTKVLTTRSDEDYGECPLGRSTYDAADHHASLPWDILYFSDQVLVNATWDKLHDTTGNLPADPFSVQTNDIDLTLGHCAHDSVWARFNADATLDADGLESGSVSAADFAANSDKTGLATAYRADLDYNVYHSDDGLFQGGTGTEVTLRFTFVPATNTATGGL